MIKIRFALALSLGLLGLSPQAGAQAPLETATAWDCIWLEAGTDNLFECEMFLTVAPDGSLSGSIHWTVTRGPMPYYDGKLGLSAVEYIIGTYVQAAGTMEFRGTSKDDAHEIIGLDVYRLEVSSDGRWLFGPTASNETWKGRFHAHRR